MSPPPATDPGPLRGVVLAGGPGSRLGGGKPWRTVAGRRLIDLAGTALERAGLPVLVVTVDVAACAGLPWEIIADRWPGQGPLAALVTAFLDSDAGGVVLLAVDLPLVRPALLARLAAAHGLCQALAIQGPRGWPEPLLAYYSRGCLPAAQRLLDSGEGRPRMLLGAVRTSFLAPAEVARLDPEGLSFLNVNYPEDLERANQAALAGGLFDTP
ncbi:MAG: NTP transferase domain-containing protein [Desulfarculus sp.]|nr:NTP transferase domain-containing protein [Desulfarculus sp.]